MKVIETNTSAPGGIMQKIQGVYRVVETDQADGREQTNLPLCDWTPIPKDGIPQMGIAPQDGN